MKAVVVMGLAVLGVWAGEAAAQCATSGSTTQVVQVSRLVGNTVCGRPGAAYPGAASDRWQEQHRGSGTTGELWDYKRGPGDSVDPSEQVGTWSISGNGTSSATVTYNYGSGGTYTYYVFNTGGVLSFCASNGSGSESVRARVKSGQTSCAAGDFPP